MLKSSSVRGLTLADLKQFADRYLYGGEAELRQLSILDIQRDVLVPFATSKHMSYVDYLTSSTSSPKSPFQSRSTDPLELQGASVSSLQPTGLLPEVLYMVTYSMDMNFQDFLETLSRFIEQSNHRVESSKVVSFWIDLFCISQKYSHQSIEWNNQVEQAIKQCADNMVVLSPWQYRHDIFQDGLALYQLFMSIVSAKPTWHMMMTKSEQIRFQEMLTKDPIRVKNELIKLIDVPIDGIDKDIRSSLLFAFIESDAIRQYVIATIQFGIKTWLWKNLKQYIVSPSSQNKIDMPLRQSFLHQHSSSHQLSSMTDNEESVFSIDGSDLESFLVDCIDDESSTLRQSSAKPNTPFCADCSYLIYYFEQLGELYLNQCKYDEAESIFLKILELQKHELGQYHLDTIESTLKLADLFVLSKKYSMAELFYLSYLKGLKESKSASARDLLIATQHVGNFFYSQASYDKALPLYESWHQQALALHGQMHHVTLHASSMLANVYIFQLKYEKALTLSRNCIEIAVALHHGNHPLVKQFKNHYEHMLKLINNFETESESSREDKYSNFEVEIESFPILEVAALESALGRAMISDSDSCYASTNFTTSESSRTCTIS